MKAHYDFSHSVPNPYAKRLKKPITIRLDTRTIAYFKKMANTEGVAYQTLIDLYLRDCAENRRSLKLVVH